MKTKHGSKIPIVIPYDIERAVGPGSRDIINIVVWLFVALSHSEMVIGKK